MFYSGGIKFVVYLLILEFLELCYECYVWICSCLDYLNGCYWINKDFDYCFKICDDVSSNSRVSVLG